MKHFFLLLIFTVFNEVFSRSLDGIYVTLDELEGLKKGLISSIASLHWYKNPALKNQFATVPTLKQLEYSLFWHQSFPTTGLRLEKPFYPPPYPYIPHYFSLWQLAPKKGKDSTVAILDTGAAAFTIKDDPVYKKNHDLFLTMPMTNQQYVLINHDGLNPLEQITFLIKTYTDPKKFNEYYIKNHIQEWITAYLKNKDSTALQHYLRTYGKPTLYTKKSLTQEGLAALHEITQGKYGISPNVPEPLKPFKLTQRTDTNEKVIVELLPIAHISNNVSTYIAGHGSHMLGLINAQFDGTNNDPNNDTGILGLAPNAKAFMIKAFDDKGISKKSILNAAIQKGVRQGADVVNLSLKIADDLDLTSQSTKELQKNIKKVSYMVCAAGNSHDNDRLKTESYPARFISVPFDVGAFGYKEGKAYLAPFSQYETGIGPLFVAPGIDILSAGLIPGQTFDSAYVFMSGTSMASSIMSGFIALMLGEFKKEFTREQLLKVCYSSAFKLHDNQEWHDKVVLGVLDMRTVLFILQTFNYIKLIFKEKKHRFDVVKKFDNLLGALHTILLSEPKRYGKKYLGGASFTTNFGNYINKAQKKAFIEGDFFIPDGDDPLKKALDYVANIVLQALNITTKERKAPLRTIKKVKRQLLQDSYNLFDTLPAVSQKRIQAKLANG